jgi:preprotein translocase subunit SecF
MATHKPFRELLNPGANFDFIGQVRTWILISVVLVAGSIAMLFVNKSVRGDYLNWTIDFKGGTEIVFGFEDKASGAPADIGSGDVRQALEKGGKSGVDVSDFSWTFEDEGGVERDAVGIIVRTPEFSAVSEKEQEEIAEALVEALAASDVTSVQWSGDRLFLRSNKPVSWEAAREFFAARSLVLKPWGELEGQFTTPVEGIGEYNSQLSIEGIGAQYETLLQEQLGDGLLVELIQVDAVGAKAGERLRNDGIKALFYAMALIMLYLAFRFDVRYAPGAVVALLHDAILVVGVFAVTWQPVSLTSVAALLTVIGYSVNDSVVIFDRIRENVERLKDKRFSRVINISLNETMSRTLITSLTTFVAALMMNIFGTGLVQNFAFALNVGVVVGVYSSIFVAAPVALAIHNRWFAGPAETSRSGRSSSGGRPSASAPATSTRTRAPASEAGLEPADLTDDEDDGEDLEDETGGPRRRGPARRGKKKRRKR